MEVEAAYTLLHCFTLQRRPAMRSGSVGCGSAWNSEAMVMVEEEEDEEEEEQEKEGEEEEERKMFIIIDGYYDGGTRLRLTIIMNG